MNNKTLLLLIVGAVGIALAYVFRRRETAATGLPFGASPFRSLSAGPTGQGSGPAVNVQTATPQQPFFFPNSGSNSLTLALAQAQAIGGAITAGGSAIRQVVEGIRNFRNPTPRDPANSQNANYGITAPVEVNYDVGPGLPVSFGPLAQSVDLPLPAVPGPAAFPDFSLSGFGAPPPDAVLFSGDIIIDPVLPNVA